MTTATKNILTIRETKDGEFELECNGDTFDVFETREEAEEVMLDKVSMDQDEADDARREEPRQEIAEMRRT